MRLLWITDPHFEFLPLKERFSFYRGIVKQKADQIIITGDIGVSDTFQEYLLEMLHIIGTFPYFVLGNHDYYKGSITKVRRDLETICHYLSKNDEPVRLTEKAAIVGCDGWGDCQFGNPNSGVILNDFNFIRELTDPITRQDKLRRLGKESADKLKGVLTTAAENYKIVYVATHVPPFAEAAWYEGKQSDNDYLTFFACKAVGDVIRDIAAEHKKTKFVVLCGHTHSGGKIKIGKNIEVLTGEARYGKPQIQRVFDIK